MLGIHVSEGTAEGWFGPGKKSAMISIVVGTIFLMSIIAAVALVATNIWGKKSPVDYNEGTSKYTSLSKSVVVAYDVLKGEAELKYTIDSDFLEVGMLSINTSLSNKSRRLIKQAEADLRIVDGQGKTLLQKYVIFIDINPGETATGRGFSMVDLGRLGGDPGKIKLTLSKVWEQATPSTTPTSTPTSSTVSPTANSPSKVVVAFFEAIKEGRYADAEKHFSSQGRVDYLAYLNRKLGGTYGSLKEAFGAIPKEVVPQKVEIINETINKQEAKIDCNLYTSSGVSKESFSLVLEGGFWKLVFLE